MDRRREVKRESESTSSSLPSALHALLYNEPTTSTGSTPPSTSAARSTLHESTFPLRPVSPRFISPYSPEDDAPTPSLSAPHARPPPLTPPDRNPSPQLGNPSSFIHQHRSYPEQSYSPEPQRGRRGGSYPRQLSPREYTEPDYHSMSYSYPQYSQQPAQYTVPYPSYTRRESHSLPRLGSSSSGRSYQHDPFPQNPYPPSLPSSMSFPPLSDDDIQEDEERRLRAPGKRKARSSPDDDDDEYREDVPHPSKRAKMPKKVQVACNFCRGRKLRCDGSRPSCWNCASRHLPCEYVDSLKRRGPGKAPKGTRATKKSGQPHTDDGQRSPLSPQYHAPIFNPDIHRSPHTPPPQSVARSIYPAPLRHYTHEDPHAPHLSHPSSSLAHHQSHFAFSTYPPPPPPIGSGLPLLHPLQTEALHHVSSYTPQENRDFAPLPRRSTRRRAHQTPHDYAGSDGDEGVPGPH